MCQLLEDLKKQKNIGVDLLKIKGVGKKVSKKLCLQLGLNIHQNKNTLDPQGEELLLKLLKKRYITGDAVTARELQDIKKKKDLGLLAGYRHTLGLPVRGQRTKNNIKTAKKLNTYLLAKEKVLSRLSSKEKRFELRKEKRKKKQENKKK